MTSYSSSFLHSLAWRFGPVGAGAVALALGGCVFDSPYWAQTFDTTTTPVPLQTWTIDKTRNVKIECSQAYHGGLQPPFGPEAWLPVTDLVPSPNASYDTAGSAIYSASAKLVLPAGCWYPDEAYTPTKYMTALRATQLTSSGSTTVYRVFDLTGLECMGRENGKTGTWFSWLTKHCAMTYSNGVTIPWVRIIANQAGPSAMARAFSSPAAAMKIASNGSPATVPAPAQVDVDVLNKVFQSEGVDGKWASPLQTRLRNSYDQVSPVGTSLVDAACRQTLCRVEVTHADVAAQERFVAALAPAGLFVLDGVRGTVSTVTEKAGLRSVYFMAREGQDLSVLAAGR